MPNLAQQIREALSMFARNGTEPALTKPIFCMSSSSSLAPLASSTPASTEANAVLAGEAGVPFQALLGAAKGVDPFSEWLSLMEVVQMLCPTWPVRDQPLRGNQWRL